MKVSIDSRTIKPGDYFIPVKGPHFDGKDFIDDVIAKGGHVLDVDLFDYAKKYRKKLTCKVIGIVGSAGKTTMKDMLAGILSQQFRVKKTRQNQNNEYGVPLTLLSADDQDDILLVEMAMRKSGDLAFLTKMVQPDMVVFTGVGKSHIEFFKSQRHLAMAKAEVFRSALNWQTSIRSCFLNSGGDYADLIHKKSVKAGYKAFLYSGSDKLAENINGCYSVCRYLGCSTSVIEQGIADYKGSDHRMVVKPYDGITVLDDSYNSNPSGVLYALQYLKRFPGRKIVVLSAMLELGDFSQQEHHNVGSWVADNEVDVAFLYGDAMRAIEPMNDKFVFVADFSDLQHHVLAELKDGDVVLIKGSRGYRFDRLVEFLDEHLS